MKHKIIFLGFIIAFHWFETYATDYKNIRDSTARQLFVKSEKIAIRERAKIEKVSFLDPVWRNEMFFRIVKTNSPDLINHTSIYKSGLISLLLDNKIEKDEYSDFDIINILFNLCIDDYIKVTDSIYSLVKKNQLKFKILERLVYQDFNITNQLARNYRNPNIQILLNQIKVDIESKKINIPEVDYGFLEELKKLISGEIWEKELKQDEIINPPLLNPKNCK